MGVVGALVALGGQLNHSVMAAVQLHQHPSLGHSLAAETVLRRTPAAGTADAHHVRPGQNAPHRGPAEVDAFPLARRETVAGSSSV